MGTPVGKREAVAYPQSEHGVSVRRACDPLAVDRSSVRYKSPRSDSAELRVAIRTVAGERRRIGYRREQMMLQRQGWLVNHKKLRRLYREENLLALFDKLITEADSRLTQT